MTTPPTLNFATLRSRIKFRERRSVWVVRIVFGLMLLTISEMVMWQHPDSHALYEWPILIIDYVALASILIDLLVRFQAGDLPGILLVSGLYGLVSSIIISHSAFENINYPVFSFVIRAMGLQTAAGFYGILLYTTILRGKDATLREISGAVGIGLLWGIWVHWYPIQPNIAWSQDPIALETAMLYVLPCIVLLGALLFAIAPRFRVFREDQLTLQWWEAILVGLPLFISLVVGMIPGQGGRSAIPYEWLFFALIIGGYAVWILLNRDRGYEPSILAETTFSSPNLSTYIVVVLAFLVAGTLSYGLIEGPESIIGYAVYWAIFVFGTAWLPLASLLMVWRIVRRDRAAANEATGEKTE
jgi:hypothetical protein